MKKLSSIALKVSGLYLKIFLFLRGRYLTDHHSFRSVRTPNEGGLRPLKRLTPHLYSSGYTSVFHV
jgi:hypothetical protein